MNVFNNPYSGKPTLSWSLQNCYIAVDNIKSSGPTILAATEQVQITYQRQLSKRYPLTTGSPITIIGVPTGSCILSTIIGPTHYVEAFLQRFGSTCNPFRLQVSTSALSTTETCQTAITPTKLVMDGCQGTQITFTLSMQDNIAIAQGQFVLQFDTLDWSNNSGSGNNNATGGVPPRSAIV